MIWFSKKTMNVDTRLFLKQQKLASLICCPNCHAELEQETATLVSGIPFSATLNCAICGEVGSVQNLKYIFGSRDKTKLADQERSFNSGLCIADMDIKKKYFSPGGAWETEGQYTRSASAGAKLSFKSKSLAVALIFLKHPWSGIARVMVDGREVLLIDLFEEQGSMQMWCPIYLGDGKHVVEVEVTGQKNARSKAAQIILVGAESAELDPSSSGTITYNSRNDGNPYPKCFDQLIGCIDKKGVILDCGSGDRSHPDTRVINFEYSMFRSPDVFGDGHRLPFKDDSFDLILSQAVIEHLYDPFTAVSEIYRVLKPGGTVYAESAFMQPLHAVPYHFFNTTGWGLEHLFKEFDIETVEYCGPLSQTLKWFYDLTALREKGFGEKVDAVLAGASELDAHITKEELSSFASYVTLLAQKPAVNQ